MVLTHSLTIQNSKTMTNEEIEQRAAERFPYMSNDIPERVRTLSLRQAYITGYQQASGEVERELEEFTEWVGANYVKLHKAWVHRFASQTQPENFLTYAQLREAFRRHQKSLRDLINPLPQPPTTI